MAPVWLLAWVLSAPANEWLLPKGLAAPPGEVQRIVSLVPSFTEGLFAIGAGNTVVGVTRYCDYPPEARQRQVVGGYVDPELETILAAKPDLVVASPTPSLRNRLLALNRLGIAVLVLPSEGQAEFWQGLVTLAGLTRRLDEARALQAQVAQALLRPRPGTPARVLAVVGYRPLIAAGPGSFADEVVRAAGATNVLSSGPNYAHVDLEAVAAQQPTVILELTMGERAPEDYWHSLLQRGVRLARLTDPIALRPGPRLAQAAERVAAAIATAHGLPAAPGVAPP